MIVSPRTTFKLQDRDNQWAFMGAYTYLILSFNRFVWRRGCRCGRKIPSDLAGARANQGCGTGRTDACCAYCTEILLVPRPWYVNEIKTKQGQQPFWSQRAPPFDLSNLPPKCQILLKLGGQSWTGRRSASIAEQRRARAPTNYCNAAHVKWLITVALTVNVWHGNLTSVLMFFYI